MKKASVVIVVFMLMVGVLVGFYFSKHSVTDSSISTQAGNTTPPNDVVGNVLDLSNKGLKKVTSDIYGKTSTNTLILSNNSITSLPSEMGKMTKVTVFKVDHNLIEGSLIGEIRQMSNLKTLDVSHNMMTGMPAEIGQLSALESLDYSYNSVDTLPNELANLKNTLKVLDLTGNPLSQEKIRTLRDELPGTNIIF